MKEKMLGYTIKKHNLKNNYGYEHKDIYDTETSKTNKYQTIKRGDIGINFDDGYKDSYVDIDRECKYCHEENLECNDMEVIGGFIHNELGYCILLECKICKNIDIWIVESQCFAKDYKYLMDLFII